MNCAEDPFNMGMFYNSRYHSKWVCFQILNTHIRAFSYWSCKKTIGIQLVRPTVACGKISSEKNGYKSVKTALLLSNVVDADHQNSHFSSLLWVLFGVLAKFHE